MTLPVARNILPERYNLVPNPSFEIDNSTWGFTALTMGRYPPLGAGLPNVAGSTAADCTCTGTASAWINTSSSFGTMLPVVGGLSYTLSAYLARLVGNRQCSLQIS